MFVLTKSKNSLKKYCHSTLIIPTQFIYRLKTQNCEFALPCYLQRLFTLQSLFVSSQIPECWWSQACVRLLNACQSKKKKTSSQDIWSYWFNEKIWVRPIDLPFKPIHGCVTHLWARWSFWAAVGCHLPLVWSVWSRCFDPDDEQQTPH